MDKELEIIDLDGEGTPRRTIDRNHAQPYWNYNIQIYMNSNHYIDLNKKNDHPSTWEFSLFFKIPKSKFIQFTQVEKACKEITAPYELTILNNEEPFTRIIPTVENVTSYFTDEWMKTIESFGGLLYRVEGRENVTRKVIIDIEDNEKLIENAKEFEVAIRKSLVTDKLDAISRKRNS